MSNVGLVKRRRRLKSNVHFTETVQQIYKMHKENTNQTNTVCRLCRMSTIHQKPAYFLDLTLNQPSQARVFGTEKQTNKKKKRLPFLLRKKKKFTIFRLKATNVCLFLFFLFKSSQTLRMVLHIKMKLSHFFLPLMAISFLRLSKVSRGKKEKVIPTFQSGSFVFLCRGRRESFFFFFVGMRSHFVSSSLWLRRFC